MNWTEDELQEALRNNPDLAAGYRAARGVAPRPAGSPSPEDAVRAGRGQPASKYKNVRTELNGLVFASKKEAARANELMLLEQLGVIFGLRFQVRFPLTDAVAGKGRPIVYVADAVYSEVRQGRLTVIVEDTKGVRTKEYRLKKKLFEAKFGIEIEER